MNPYKEVFVYDNLRKYLEDVVMHYEAIAPTVSQYADAVYVRLGDGAEISLWEVTGLMRLYDVDNNRFITPSYAANTIFKLMAQHGKDTTGHLGF